MAARLAVVATSLVVSEASWCRAGHGEQVPSPQGLSKAPPGRYEPEARSLLSAWGRLRQTHPLPCQGSAGALHSMKYCKFCLITRVPSGSQCLAVSDVLGRTLRSVISVLLYRSMNLFDAGSSTMMVRQSAVIEFDAVAANGTTAFCTSTS